MRRAFEKLYTVYGGQFGSEGKGQIVRYIAEKVTRRDYCGPGSLIAYRIGGPNAGHTFYIDGDKVVTCQIPGPMFVHKDVVGVIGPEGVISLEVLKQELENLKATNKARPSLYPVFQNLLIDKSAVIITEEQHHSEANLVKSIGSTGKGVGAATADKILRNDRVVTANYSKDLAELAAIMEPDIHIVVTDTITAIRSWTHASPHYVGIIEGTQGAGLSIHTSGHFPYCTSRECTPQGIWAGTGLHPEMARDHETIMVVRTYPIRVAGPSGPMSGETSWEVISQKIGREVKEITTVTKNVRRVSEIDIPALQRTVWYTRPDSIALNFLDYVDPAVYKKDPNESEIARDYIEELQKQLDVPVKYVGTGEGHVYEWLQ